MHALAKYENTLSMPNNGPALEKLKGQIKELTKDLNTPKGERIFGDLLGWMETLSIPTINLSTKYWMENPSSESGQDDRKK